MLLVNLFAIYLPAIFGVTMLIVLGFRFFQLKNTGQHLQKKYNSTIKSRICLLLLCILLILTLNFISILNTNFYLYGQDYSQIFIFLVIVYSTQVGTILFEYNKNMPSMKYHKIFWILCLICNIFVAIINFINEYKDNKYDIVGNIVLYFIILNQLVLNCYSLFIRKQDKIEFESISGFGVTVPIIEENKENTVPLFNSFIGLQSSLSQFKILVHFSKTWKIIQQKDGQIDAIITLKIFLQNPNQHYQLKKSITDFIELEKQLLKENKFHSEIYKLPDEFFRQSNDTHYLINEKLSIIKTYLRKIISKTEYLNQTLQDFLQFDDATKNLINREMRNKANSFDQSI